MAQGRMLSKDTPGDRQFNELPSDTCRLAFCLAITQLDRDGRMHGDPAVVRSMLFPRRADITAKQVEGFISTWESRGLVIWYETEGDHWLSFPAFRKHQPKLRYDQEAPSRIPPPSEDDLQRFDNVVATVKKPLNRMNNNERECIPGGAVAPPSMPVDKSPPKEAARKGEAKQVYGEDVTMTPEQHAALVAKFGPEAVTRAIEKLSSYKLSKGKKYKSDYHAMLQWVFEAIGAPPKAKKQQAGWKCPKCGRWNNHSGSGCLDPRCGYEPGAA